MDAEQELEDVEISYPVQQNFQTFFEIRVLIYDDEKFSMIQKHVQMLFLTVYFIINSFYVMVYFYFFPFGIVLLIFIFGDDQLIPKDDS